MKILHIVQLASVHGTDTIGECHLGYFFSEMSPERQLSKILYSKLPDW